MSATYKPVTPDVSFNQGRFPGEGRGPVAEVEITKRNAGNLPLRNRESAVHRPWRKGMSIAVFRGPPQLNQSSAR